MDIPRSSAPNRLSRTVIVASIVLSVTLVLGLTLRPAAPKVNRSSLWIDVVRRGDLSREVRASGSLIPQDMRWVTAATSARVDRVLIRPGTSVDENTIILEMDDPQTLQNARESEWRLRQAQAEYLSVRAELASARLDAESSAGRLDAERDQLSLRAQADARLMQEGVIAPLTAHLSKSAADDAARRFEIEQKRLAARKTMDEMKLGAEQAKVEQIRAADGLQQERKAMLEVRAGMKGILQQVNVEAGQSVAAGANLAKIAAEGGLEAQLRVAESDASEIRVGQKAQIDTHKGLLAGRVARIDPSVRDGSVIVDVTFDRGGAEELRPDLSVDGAIELAKLPSVLLLARPAQARERGTASVFRILPGRRVAERVDVTFGSASTNSIQIITGLNAGDQVIVSDTSAWEKVNELTIGE